MHKDHYDQQRHRHQRPYTRTESITTITLTANPCMSTTVAALLAFLPRHGDANHVGRHYPLCHLEKYSPSRAP